MVFGKRPPAPEPKHILKEPPKFQAEELLWNLGLGLFCLLAVLFIGQVARLLLHIGSKLSNAMCPPVPEPPARRKRQSMTAGTAGGSSHHNTPMPPANNIKPNLWPYYKRGMSLADEPNPNPKAAAAMAPSAAGKGFSPMRAPTGAGASPTSSCRSDNCSDSGCCSPTVVRKPGRLGIAPGKEKGHSSPLLSAEAAAEQSRLRREQAEEYEEMEALLKEQETRLAEQEEALTRHFKERTIKLVGYLLDDMFERDPIQGSTLVNSIPAGLKHSCFMSEIYRRMMEAEAHGLAHAASNPMAIKRAIDDTFEAQIDQARKGLTPRRQRKVTDALALKKEEKQGPNYPHPPRYMSGLQRFRPPDVKERTKWWWYYQLKNAEEGKFHTYLMAAFQSPDGFPTDLLPNVDCGCCFKPNQQKPFTLGGDRNEPLPRVFGPHEYARPTFKV